MSRLRGIRGLLLDVDGVLTAAGRPLPGAPRALARLRDLGIPFVLATNTTELSRAELAGRLGEGGFDIEPAQIVTAPVVTAAYLRGAHPGAPCFLLGAAGAVADMEGVRFVEDEGQVVVLGGADPSFSWQNLNRAFRMLLRGAALVAMHRNLAWRTAEGWKLDTGAFLPGLEAAAGTRAVVCGKPSPAFFRHCLAVLSLPPREVAMVGDDLGADVRPARELGMVGVLVRSPDSGPRPSQKGRGQPDVVIEALAELPPLLTQRSGA
jgi:HAD superfamily hydrolase (TIGR01458 family)